MSSRTGEARRYSGAAAVRGVGWASLQAIGSRGTTTLVFILLARLLEPEVFGVVALAAVFIAVLTQLSDQGFGQALIQRNEVTGRHVDTAFWIGIATGVACAALLSLLSPVIAGALDVPELALVLQVMSLTLVMAPCASVPQALLKRALRFKPVAIRALIANLAGSVVAVAVAVSGGGVWSLVAQQLVATAVGIVVLWQATSWRPRLRWGLAEFRDLFSFGSRALGVTLLNVVNRRSDDFLIGAVLGPVALGIYSVAYRLLRMMTDVLVSTVNTVAFPAFASLQHDSDRLVRAYLRATRVGATLSIPAFVVVSIVADDLVLLLFGTKWEASIPVMRVLAFIGTLHAISYFNSSVLLASGRPGLMLKFSIVNTVANVALFAAVVRYGILAVAIAYVVRGYVMAPWLVYMVRTVHPFPVRDYVRAVLRPLLAVAVMAAVTIAVKWNWLSGAPEGLSLAASLAVALAAYLAALMLVDRKATMGLIREVRTVRRAGKRPMTSGAA